MNTLKTIFLMTALTLLLVTIGNLVGGRSGMMIAFVFAVGMNFFSYWFSDKMTLRMYRAREVSQAQEPELYSLVRELATKARLPMPKIYLTPGDQPNAFATGRNPQNAAIAVTNGILRMLQPDELAGVIAHELAHVKNRDILIGSIAATLAGAIAMLANMAQWAMIFGGGDDEEEGGGILALLITAIVSPIAAMLIQMGISRSREYLADATAARIVGNSFGLANALRKLEQGAQMIPMQATPASAHLFIVNPLRGGGLANLFSTHPPMQKRIAKLESMKQKDLVYAA